MKNKLENLLSFNDFKSNWNEKKSSKTKRTDTGLDILKEGVEEIIPEGIPEEYDLGSQSVDGKIEEIEKFVDDADEDIIDKIIDILRDALLEMEQQGFIEETTTDDLDDEHGSDWIAWIKNVINIPELPEDVLNNIIDLIKDPSLEYISDEEIEDEIDGDMPLDFRKINF